MLNRVSARAGLARLQMLIPNVLFVRRRQELTLSQAQISQKPKSKSKMISAWILTRVFHRTCLDTLFPVPRRLLVPSMSGLPSRAVGVRW